MKTQVDKVWKVERTKATLSTSEIEGSVDLASPESGLTVKNAFGKSLHDGTILAFTHVPRVERFNSDQYVRGGDLVATYQSDNSEKKSGNELRLTDQVYWRHFSLEDPCRCHGTELVISLQTDRLDLQPRIQIRTQLVAHNASLVQLKDGQPEIETITNSLDFDPSGVIGILVRNQEDKWSYLQSLHFTDEHSCDRIQVRVDENHVEISVLLLVDHLEKGVIRRARLRGAFLNTIDVKSDALSHWFAEFAESELPLTV